MYKFVMGDRHIFKNVIILFLTIFAAELPRAETAIRDSVTLDIAHDVWYNRHPDAIKKAERLIKKEKDNPLGYFLLGTVYQTISEEFYTDRFKDKSIESLDKAIDMAEKRKDEYPQVADWAFIAGAAYGYRALHRAFHGGWWGAFQDGLHCSSNLQKALKLDSTFYDAYLGLGAYHYYKTVKAKDFLWLPFVSDQRQQGIEELRIAIDSGYLASFNARESLLRIYYEEGRYDDAISLADSLEKIIPNDPYCLMYHARSLIGLDRLDEAQTVLRNLTLAWKDSPYYDPIGMFEAELMQAEIFHRGGDDESARKIIDTIIAQRKMAKDNAYFADTVKRAKQLSKKLR